MTTNSFNTFILVAKDCPAFVGVVPPIRNSKTVARIEYELLIHDPYRFTSDDVLYIANGERRRLSRDEFFARTQPDFRLSPLTQRYGWGVHSDLQGRIALYGVGSLGYEMLARDASLRQLQAYRSRR